MGKIQPILHRRKRPAADSHKKMRAVIKDFAINAASRNTIIFLPNLHPYT
jgi:hypothetical protein